MTLHCIYSNLLLTVISYNTENDKKLVYFINLNIMIIAQLYRVIVDESQTYVRRASW